jgi:hypothetical protein
LSGTFTTGDRVALCRRRNSRIIVDMTGRTTGAPAHGGLRVPARLGRPRARKLIALLETKRRQGDYRRIGVTLREPAMNGLVVCRVKLSANTSNRCAGVPSMPRTRNVRGCECRPDAARAGADRLRVPKVRASDEHHCAIRRIGRSIPPRTASGAMKLPRRDSYVGNNTRTPRHEQ